MYRIFILVLSSATLLVPAWVSSFSLAAPFANQIVPNSNVSHASTNAGHFPLWSRLLISPLKTSGGNVYAFSGARAGMGLVAKIVARATNTSNGRTRTYVLDGRQSRDSSGKIVSYTWKLKGHVIGHRSTLKQNLTIGRTYTYTLNVKDSKGLTSTSTKRVKAVHKPPVYTPPAQ